MSSSEERLPVSMSARIEDPTLKAAFRISGYTFATVPIFRVTLRESGSEGPGEAAGVCCLETRWRAMRLIACCGNPRPGDTVVRSFA